MLGKKLTVFIAGCILTACTDTIVIEQYEEDEDSLTNAYIQLTWDKPVETRAGDSDYDIYFPGTDPTEDERWLYNIVLFIFDKNHLLERIVFDDYWQSLPSNAGKNSQAANGENHAFPIMNISAGIHYFYALVNAPKNLIAEYSNAQEREKLIGTLTKKELDDMILDVESIHKIFRYKRINQGSGYVDPPGTHEDSRGFLMTNVEHSRPYYLVEMAANEIGYYPDQNNIQLKLGRAVGKVSLAYLPEDGGEEEGSLTDIEYIVKNNPSQMYLYPKVEDLGTNELLTPHYYETSYKDEFFSDITAHDYLPATTRNITDKAQMSVTYCIENNNLKPLQGNSTMMLVRACFHPSVWLDGTAGIENQVQTYTPANGKTFWRVAQYNSRGVFQTYLPGYYDSEPSVTSPLVAHKYEDGISYYPVWLINGSKHMVKRNAYYKVRITAVNGAGEPDLDKVIDPEIPIENLTHGRISVDIIDWEEEKQGVELDGNNPFF